MPEWLQVLMAFTSPLCAAVGAYAAVRAELKWLRSDVDRAHRRLDFLGAPHG